MKNLTSKQIAELKYLAAMPDEAIDTSDIPEITNWSGAVVGRFYRPVKQPVTLRLDTDVVDWFKSRAGKYQTAMNQVLRAYMEQRQARK
jgi:uncharacterized protein (DUF4415 family)